MRESYLSQLGKENETLDLVLLHGQVSEDEFEKSKRVLTLYSKIQCYSVLVYSIRKAYTLLHI